MLFLFLGDIGESYSKESSTSDDYSDSSDKNLAKILSPLSTFLEERPIRPSESFTSSSLSEGKLHNDLSIFYFQNKVYYF